MQTVMPDAATSVEFLGAYVGQPLSPCYSGCQRLDDGL